MKRVLIILVAAAAALSPLLAEAEEAPAPKAFGGLKGSVEIVIDTFGIPHIYAGNEGDAMFALGYLHAHDRLWQMDYNRRAAEGKLSEIMGESALTHDTFIRTIGLNRLAERSAERIKDYPRLYRNLKAYSWGVNSYIAEVMDDDLPIEFLELQYKPDPWKIEDSLAIGKAMSWELCGSMDDLYLGTLVEKLGWDTVNELFPINRCNEVPIIPAEEYHAQPPAEVPSENMPDNDGSAMPKNARARHAMPLQASDNDGAVPEDTAEAAISIISALSRCAHILGDYKNIGSNNWVIDGKKSASGMPILASDPHLGFHMPAVWYAAHIKGGSLDVEGVTLPGLPVVTIGRNRHIAWGLTNTQADGTDFFRETVNEEGTQYLYQGKWRPLAYAMEVIKVRGARQKELKIPVTIHGPMMAASGQNLAIQWIGAEPDDDALAYYLLNHANDFDDFAEAMQTINSPPQNFVYADSNGMIAMWVAGLFPIRKSGLGRVPVDGSSGDFDWVRFVGRMETPHCVNPDQGFLASANQRPAPPSYPYYLGYEWDPGYRARRINVLLTLNDSISSGQMKKFQADTFDCAAQSMLPWMLESLTQPFEEETPYERSRELLAGWDFLTSADKPDATIWWAWLNAFRDNVWKDEWQAAGLDLKEESWGHTDLNKWQPPLEVLERMVADEPTSHWFDDVSTPGRETLKEIAGRSFVEAIDKLTTAYGPDVSTWQWGRVNRLRINHLSGDPVLSRGGQPMSGSDLTLSAKGNGTDVTGGPSWRMVVDFGALDEASGVYPGGQSGDPQNPHYDDLLDMWVKDKYIPLYFYPDAEQFPQKQVESRLIFVAPPDSDEIFAP